MTLLEAIDAYVDWRRAYGAKFIKSAERLHLFCRHVGGDIDCDAVREEDVLDFLAGNGPLTRYRAYKYGALAGFWRHADNRIMPRSRPKMLIYMFFLPPFSA